MEIVTSDQGENNADPSDGNETDNSTTSATAAINETATADLTPAEKREQILRVIYGPGMYYLALFFLLLLATVMVLWIDVPRVVDSVELPEDGTEVLQLSEAELRFEETAYNWGKFAGYVLLIIWPVFIAEYIFHFLMLGSVSKFFKQHPFWWAICLVPPLRIGARRKTEDADQIWLPTYGWMPVNRELRRELERAFSIPIIWIALLILPVLGLQFYFKEGIADYPMIRIALHFGTGLIWFAFTFEFIVMVSVAESKLAYCKRHWLDLVIILLPLISFLRTLRLIRASKLVKVGRLQQLTKVVRAYRLRGVAMRGLRALMLLEVLNRLLRIKPEKQLKKLMKLYDEKQRELEELQYEIDSVKEIIALHEKEQKEREESQGDSDSNEGTAK